MTEADALCRAIVQRAAILKGFGSTLHALWNGAHVHCHPAYGWVAMSGAASCLDGSAARSGGNDCVGAVLSAVQAALLRETSTVARTLGPLH